MAKAVQVRIARTINTGNYENVILDFTITDEVGPDEKFGQAFERVYGAVEAKMNIKLAENGLA